MPKQWKFEELQEEALKYKTRAEFAKKNTGAYLSSKRRGFYDQITSHMPIRVDQSKENNPNSFWTLDKLIEEALKFKSKKEFRKGNPAAYLAATRNKDYHKISSHMPKKICIKGSNNPNYVWTSEMLSEEALKYKTRGEFQKNNPSALYTAWKRQLLNQICSHMKDSGNSSIAEINIFDRVQDFYPKTQKLRDRKVKIENMPNIKGFDLDIYVPELRKAIEFDGLFFHSIKGLKWGRSKWSDEELQGYHEFKDNWFTTKGIQILHIKEKDWIDNREKCIDKIEEFLGITNFMPKKYSKAV